MGAESSSLHGFELEAEVNSSTENGWTLNSAKRQDGTHVSVFIYEKSNKNADFVENAAKV